MPGADKRMSRGPGAMVSQITLPASDNDGDKDDVSDTMTEGDVRADERQQQLNDTVDELELRATTQRQETTSSQVPQAPATVERSKIKVYKIDLANNKRVPQTTHKAAE